MNITFSPIISFQRNLNIQKNIVNQTCGIKQKPLSLDVLRNDSVSFGYGLFLKKHDGLHCAYCNKELLTEEKVKNTSKKIVNKKGYSAIYMINKYMRNPADPVRKTVISKLKKEVRKNKTLSLAQIIDQMTKEKEPEFVKKQVILYKIMLKIAKTQLPTKLYKKIRRILPPPSVQKIMNMPPPKNPKHNPLKNTRIRYKLHRVKEYIEAKPITDPKSEASKKHYLKTIDSIMDIAFLLPVAKRDPDAFIVKYGKQGPERFCQMLISPHAATADHIVTRTSGGPGDKNNYLNCCTNCNWERGDMPFHYWIELKPEHKKNLVKYFEELHSLLNSPKDTRINIHTKAYYKDYPNALYKTIREASRGKFELSDEDLKFVQ